MSKWNALCWVAVSGLTLACDVNSQSPSDTPAVGGDPEPPRLTGCEVASPPPSAPGGFYVNGNTICTAEGNPHVLRGVNRPSLEWSRAGDHLSARDFRLMASWGANVVRMGLNQAFWLEGSPQFDPNYLNVIDSAVAWAKEAGLAVILDLHWSDAGVLGSCASAAGCQQKMADDNSITFWSEVATRYRDDGRVIFELYNEPHSVSWEVWRAGGTVDTYHAAGMQQLYDAVREAGANNLVIIGGLDWAYDLSGVPNHRIVGHNIAYATHPYNTPHRQPAVWDRSWGSLTATDPVIVTEFGNLNDASCTTDYASKVIQYADERAAGWVAWAWYPGGCKFPALIEDWSGTPSAVGLVVREALLSHGGPHPVVEPEEDVPLRYTFDTGAEAWALSDYVDPDYTNLGAEAPEGGERARLTYIADDGDPTSGSLELRVNISAIDQYVIAQAQVARNLTGKTLHARVKLQAGSLNGTRVWLHACTGATFVCAQGSPIDPTLTPGEWLPLEWDLATVTTPGFDATEVISLGVTVDATVNPDGTPREGALSEGSDATLRIDTFTE